uniref:Protein slender lobes n=1 Tax=Ceratitis capitata TaxID=7213 RepID=W8B3S2_CERCA
MESLEDVSTGGRVTRSLRKRLASVDSESNSRPSTPQLTKLTAIPETSSPSRPLRGTRRNSLTGNATPSKSVGRPRKSTICEEIDAERTPAKRNTRRSSVCVNDTQTPKTLQIDNSLPKANSINEKSVINARSIADESESSPPLVFDVEKTPRPSTNKKNKPGPKSRRSKNSNESDSDIEVINLEEKEISSNNSNRKSEEKVLKTPTRTSPRLQAKNFSPKGRCISMETIDLSEDSVVSDNNKNAEEHINSNVQTVNKDENENINLEDTKSNVSLNMSTKEPTGVLRFAEESESEVCLDIKTPEKSTSKPIIESVVMIQKLSPKVMAKYCGDVAAINSPNSKSVTFNDVDTDDDVIKHSYPKTPASIKSKSYLTNDLSNEIEDKSFQSDKESVNSFKDASAHLEEFAVHSEKGNQSKESVEFHDATNDNAEENSFPDDVDVEEMKKDITPHKQKLLTNLQSSTPMIDSVSPSKPDQSNKQKEIVGNSSEKSPIQSPQRLHDSLLIKKDKSEENILHEIDNKNVTEVDLADNTNKNEEKEELFSKSWTHNVSGNATSNGKIDTIAVPFLEAQKDELLTDMSKNPNEQKNTSTLQNENDEEENEDDYETFQKLEFVDDEAIDAGPNYESGDSMDDEERKEMLENEIIDEGESIGSEDTLSDNINEDDDNDEENASFITSDSEDSAIEYSDTNEPLEDNYQNTTKPTRKSRISSTSGSEADVQFSDENKDETANSNSKKKKRLSNTKRKNRILSTSDSDVGEPTDTRKTTLNSDESIHKSDKPLDLNVSKMIDESTDDEVITNEISEKVNDHNKDNEENNIIANQEFGSDENKISESHKSDIESDNNLDELNVSNFANADDVEQANNSNNSKQKINAESNELGNITKTASECTNPEYSSNSNELSSSKNITNEQMFDMSAIEKEEVLSHERHMEETERKQNNMERSNASNNSNNSEHESNAEKYIEEEDIEIPETQEVDKQILEAESSNESNHEETAKELSDENYEQKVKSSGLSVSFCPVKQKRTYVKIGKERKRHSSFTISVNVIKPETSYPVVTRNRDSDSSTDSSATDRESTDEFENINLTNRTISSAYKKRKSMVSFNVGDIGEFPHCKKSKRNSIQSMPTEDFNPSQSLIETIEDRKQELSKAKKVKSTSETFQNDPIGFTNSGDPDTLENAYNKETNQNCSQSCSSKESSSSQLETEDAHNKITNEAHSTTKTRLSKSFCGPIQTGVTTSLDNSALDLSNNEVENKIKNSSTPQNLKAIKKKKTDYSQILNRCDEIIDAANRAKLESKQNYKKSSVVQVKSRKKSKLSSGSEEEWANNKNNNKHSQEKTSQALEQALKASAQILMKEASKNKKGKLLQQLSEEQYAEKRLPMQLLESLSNSESQDGIKLDNKESSSPLVHRMNCASGEIVEEILSPPKKKRAILNKFELPSGTVLEEPITPKKKMKTGGFRESPITPRTIGFKVKHILSAGQDNVPESLASNRLKRKYNISDPQRVLPKPQWSQSGVFLEEPLPSVNHSKIRKLQGSSTCGAGASFATVNAMNFKNSTLFRKSVPREASHEMLKRKERQYIRNYF